jgi:hypothetical protein
MYKCGGGVWGERECGYNKFKHRVCINAATYEFLLHGHKFYFQVY